MFIKTAELAKYKLLGYKCDKCKYFRFILYNKYQEDEFNCWVCTRQRWNHRDQIDITDIQDRSFRDYKEDLWEDTFYKANVEICKHFKEKENND